MTVGIRTAALCAAVACVLAAVPSQTAAAAPSSMLRRYPYLTDLVTTNVTINWASTTAGTTGSVGYGRVGVESCTAHTENATKTTITVGSTTEYQWKATLSGLATNTAYCYRVFTGTTDLLGSDLSPVFHSQVPAGSNASYSFAVFGDWGSVDSSGSNPDQARLMSQIAASGARFAINTGDTAYNSGTQTNYGDLAQTGAETSAVFGPSFWTVAGSSIAMFAAQGNHGTEQRPAHELAAGPCGRDVGRPLSDGHVLLRQRDVVEELPEHVVRLRRRPRALLRPRGRVGQQQRRIDESLRQRL